MSRKNLTEAQQALLLKLDTVGRGAWSYEHLYGPEHVSAAALIRAGVLRRVCKGSTAYPAPYLVRA
jgi:hypothetical protein